MPKTKIKARRLVRARATHVSIVDRGANQVPFKVIKAEDSQGANMLDFGLRTLFKAEDTSPEFTGAPVALIVSPDVDQEVAETALKEAGFDVDNRSELGEGDGAMVAYLQKDDTALGEEGQMAFKLSDNVGIVVEVSKEFVGFMTSSDFTENLQKQGFFPGIRVAMDILGDTISNSIFDAASPSDAAATVGKAVDAFKGYALGILKEIPKDAFKMETPLVTPDANPSTPEASPEATTEKVEKTESEEEATPAGSEAGAEAEVEKKEEAEVEKTEADGTAKILEALGGLTETVKGVSEKVDGLESKVDKAQETADEAARVAKSADEAISGTVPATPNGDPGDHNSSSFNWGHDTMDSGMGVHPLQAEANDA